MTKRVLLLCASHNDLGLIRGLKKLGCEILVTGAIPGLIGEKYCDRYICQDYSDKEAILRIAKEEQVDRICACCNDFGVYTAAYVAEKLGLPGYDSYETTCILHNKDKFKRFAKEQGLLSPWTEAFEEEAPAEEFLQHTIYPVIVKPVDASAGNGITRANTFAEAKEAVQTAFAKSREKRIVIEQYLTGTQHGFCTFLVNQKVACCCSNNEYSIQNPYRVEIDTFPADNYDQVADTLISEIEKIAGVLSLKDGIFHLQYIFSDGKPMIIEVMRRAIGNMYAIPAGMLNGIEWDYWEARALIGESCASFPAPVVQEGCFAYKAVLADQNGVIRGITIPKEYERYLVDQCMLKTVGDEIKNHFSEPVGLLFFMFRDREEMERVLIREYRNDLVTIE